MKNTEPIPPIAAQSSSPTPFARAYILWDAWLLFLGLLFASGVSLWVIQTMPGVVDPAWQPVFGPGLGGPRPSTIRWLGVGLLTLALTIGPLVAWWRPTRALGLGLSLGWLGGAILFWIYK